jgi:hypothetical protein
MKCNMTKGVLSLAEFRVIYQMRTGHTQFYAERCPEHWRRCVPPHLEVASILAAVRQQ